MEPANLRMCSCQALKPSQRLRLYEYLEPIVSFRTVANDADELEFGDMRILAVLPESFAMDPRYPARGHGRKLIRV
jgi:hypothetical protein